MRAALGPILLWLVAGCSSAPDAVADRIEAGRGGEARAIALAEALEAECGRSDRDTGLEIELERRLARAPEVRLAVDRSVRMLGDADGAVRACGAGLLEALALWRLEDAAAAAYLRQEAVPALVGMLSREPDRRAVLRAFRAFAELKDPRCVLPMARVLAGLPETDPDFERLLAALAEVPGCLDIVDTWATGGDPEEVNDG
ncbi:MAG: hypothetical protein HY722_16700 [Planctomycetes bacterium]|nr:hypothetical protein [Planctomycetota bacterium]